MLTRYPQGPAAAIVLKQALLGKRYHGQGERRAPVEKTRYSADKPAKEWVRGRTQPPQSAEAAMQDRRGEYPGV